MENLLLVAEKQDVFGFQQNVKKISRGEKGGWGGDHKKTPPTHNQFSNQF